MFGDRGEYEVYILSANIVFRGMPSRNLVCVFYPNDEAHDHDEEKKGADGPDRCVGSVTNGAGPFDTGQLGTP